MVVYTSEFCNETWDVLTVDWAYEEFLDMYNRVMYFTELKTAVNMDQEREKAKEDAKSK